MSVLASTGGSAVRLFPGQATPRLYDCLGEPRAAGIRVAVPKRDTSTGFTASFTPHASETLLTNAAGLRRCTRAREVRRPASLRSTSRRRHYGGCRLDVARESPSLQHHGLLVRGRR